MGNPEIERWLSRALLPRYVVLALIGAAAWSLGAWMAALAHQPDSIPWLLVAAIAWILLLFGRGLTVSMGILIPLLGLHWLINTVAIRSSRSDHATPTDSSFLTFSWPWKTIGYAALAFAIFCGVIFLPAPGDRMLGIVMTLALTLAGAFSLFTFNLRSIRVSPYGLEIVQPFRSRQLPWSSIKSAHVKDEYLVLIPNASRSERISIHMRNVDHLFGELERRHLFAVEPAA